MAEPVEEGLNTSFLLPEAALREAEATTGRIVVRYIYSGNEKIVISPELRKEQALPGFSGSVLARLCEHAGTIINPRVDATTGARSWYYFINNAQGTPVLILDESGGTISRVNLDEWGNVGQLIGPASEVNYTGKKMDPETGLYYFNQRYYDPSLGRFLTEDPAGQGLNPYAYAGNSPLMYVDPDGEFFFLVPFLVAAAQGAAISAAINVTAQLVTTGQVNWNSVGQSAIGGALGGALSFGVGQMFGPGITDIAQFGTKTVAHGVSGGIQSWAQGGDFGSGFLSGSVGHAAGFVGNSIGGDLGGVGPL